MLTISVFAWSTSQANVQRRSSAARRPAANLAKQAAAAVRDRGADGVNLDFEPLASGYADEFVLFLKAVRTELNRVKAGYQLTYDTTGFVGNYPLEASVGAGAADAIFVMGYDYRTAGSSTAGSIDPLSGPKYDLTDTVRTYTARVSPSRVILGLPWYGRAWSTTTSAVRAPNQSGTKFGTSSRANLREHRRPRRAVRAPLGPGRAEPVRRLPAPELHEHVRLRDQLAAGLLRGRAVAEAAARHGQRLRPARRRDVGPGQRRRPSRALPRLRRVVPHRQVRPAGRHPVAPGRPRRRRVRRHLGGDATRAASRASTSRSRPTAARGRHG